MRRNHSRSLILLLVIVAGVVAGCQDAFVSSGILYQEQDKWGKAEQMFKTAIWRNEENADAHYQLAYTYGYRTEWEHLERGEVDSARIKVAGAHEHYLRAAELKPDKYRFNPEAETEELATPSETGIKILYATMFNKGVSLQKDDPEEAIMYFELAGLADPRGAAGFDASLLVYQLRYNQSYEDDDAVREILTKADMLEIGEDWPDANAKRASLVDFKATMYRTLGQDAMAGRLYESLLESDPENIDLIRNVAATRLNGGDQSGAAALYERALGIAEADPLKAGHGVDVRYGLALAAADARYQAEDYEQCVEVSEKGLTLATSNDQRSQMARNIGWSHYELEQYEDCALAAESVVMDGGYDTVSLDGWNLYRQVLIKLGRIEEASQARDRYNALQDAG